MNPLLEYNLYIKEAYRASVGEWEDWAERIVECLQAEMMAAENDHERYKKLKADLAKTTRAMQAAIDAGTMAVADIRDLRIENAALKRENERLSVDISRVVIAIDGGLTDKPALDKIKRHLMITLFDIGFIDALADTRGE